MKWTIVILLFMYPVLANGQLKVERIFLGFGPIAYSGDISHNYSQWNPVISGKMHLGKGYLFEKSVHFTGGSFQAESSRSISNQSFFLTKFVNVALHLGYSTTLIKNMEVSISAGPGLMYFNPEDAAGNALSALTAGKFEGENYRNLTISADALLAVYYHLKNDMYIGCGTGFTLPFSDYTDNISRAVNDVNRDNLLRFEINFGFPIIRNFN